MNPMNALWEKEAKRTYIFPKPEGKALKSRAFLILPKCRNL